MLNSTEKKLLTANKKQDILAFKLLDVFILLINVKILTIIGIVTLIGMINYTLNMSMKKLYNFWARNLNDNNE